MREPSSGETEKGSEKHEETETQGEKQRARKIEREETKGKKREREKEMPTDDCQSTHLGESEVLL